MSLPVDAPACNGNMRAADEVRLGQIRAGVVKLVDALDSKSSSERSVGSTPTARTKINGHFQRFDSCLSVYHMPSNVERRATNIIC